MRIAGSLFLVLQQHLHALAGGMGHQLRHTVDEVLPYLPVIGLEGVVVAFRSRPDDEVRGYLGSHVDAGLRRIERPLAESAIRVDERTQGIVRNRKETQRQTVDILLAEDTLDGRQVVLVDLRGVVVLEAVDEVTEASDGALGALFHRFIIGRRVIATGHKAGGVRPKGPDANAVLDSFCHACLRHYSLCWMRNHSTVYSPPCCSMWMDAPMSAWSEPIMTIATRFVMTSLAATCSAW